MTFRAMAAFLLHLGRADGLLTLVLASEHEGEWALCLRDNVHGHLHWIAEDPARADAYLYTSPRPIDRIAGLPVDAPYTWLEVRSRLISACRRGRPWRIARIAIGDGHLLLGDRYAMEVRPREATVKPDGNGAAVGLPDGTVLLEDNGVHRVLMETRDG